MEAKAMLTTIEGVYRNGRIELSEQPKDVREARVFVTFAEIANGQDARNGRASRPIMRFGMFPGDGATNEEDFELAERRGDNPAR
jgi:hypothetical protein